MKQNVSLKFCRVHREYTIDSNNPLVSIQILVIWYIANTKFKNKIMQILSVESVRK